jgi:endonuclease/exonuclease/phosphatase family metal-dependent hydrolase
VNRKQATREKLFAWMAGLMAVLLSFGVVSPVRAVDVRIATMNVCNLSDGRSLSSLSNVLQRVQPDVLALQECSSSDEEKLTALMARLSKPMAHRAFMPNPGTGRKTASGDKVAIYSAWPIVEASIVKENYHDPDAIEFMRWPIHAKIGVPGALNPLHVVTLHATATTVSTPRRIWRGLEARRVREYVAERILGADGNDVEYVVLGDFNDSAPGRWTDPDGAASFQEESFTYAQFRKAETNANTTSGFGGEQNFVLGRDHPWYVTNSARASHTETYRTYPTERFGDMLPVTAFQTGSASNWVTDWKGSGKGESDQGIYRLDYILFSSEIMASSYGAPEAEVYYSAYDGPGVGLPKPGPVPPAWASTNVTDHLLVFSDFHMIDEVGGITPVAILSEIAAHPTDPYANFVEICNTGNGDLDLSGYSLELFLDDESSPSATYPLDGVALGPGGVYWIAGRSNDAVSRWKASPDAVWSDLASVNGNDTVVLRGDSGAIHDIYGAIGIDGASKPWCYAGSVAIRNTGVTDPMATWQAIEWTIATNASAATATPGTHTAVSEANVSLAGVALHAADRDSTAPLASDPFRFGATAHPNLAASNLAVEAAFRVNGGAWITTAMTNSGGRDWTTPALNVARAGGSVMDYRVSVAFDGAGDFSPVVSAEYSYTFPAATTATNLADVLVNEVKTSGTDNEFVELLGAAGQSLAGWALEWYGDNADLIWRFDFPAGAAVTAAGLQDEWTNALGFYVVASSSGTAGCNAVFTNAAESASAGLMSDSPRILVLRNGENAVVDAVALASTNAFVAMSMPAGLSTDVARGAPNYLHCLGAAATGETLSRQAPNNVRTGCSADGLYELPDWCATNAATPGALNGFQTNYCLRLARVDRDADGLLDDMDNCPSDPNTAQADTDGDGYGDICDTDMDGDAVPNGLDNCPTEYNPMQEDFDADGTGNACDPDFVAEDWEGAVETLFVDFENASKGSYTTTVTNSMGGRKWILSPETAVGSGATDKKIARKSLRTRTNAVLTLVGTLTNGLDTLSFFHGAFGSDKTPPDIVVETAADGGTNWVEHWRVKTSTNFVSSVTNKLDIPDNSSFRIRTDGGSATKRLNIDNILLVAELPTAAACELAAEITVEHDGNVHTNEFYVTPSTAAWTVLYTEAGGATTAAPSEVGTYTATVAVEAGAGWAAAEFVFPDSLSITERHDPPVVETDATTATAVSAILTGRATANTDESLNVILEYGTSTAFGNKLVITNVTGHAATEIFHLLENLQPETLYHWRLHVGDAVSETRDFNTDSLGRPEPVLDGVDASQALFSWPAVEGATNYVLDVYSIDGAGSVSNIAVDFRDWTYSPSNGDSSSAVKTQETAIGTWTFSGVSIYDIGQSSGIGSQGYASFRGSSAWLQFPPLDGVSAISAAARGPYGSSSVTLQASDDGGETFTDVESFPLSTTVMSNRHAWAAGQPEGTVFRLQRSGRNTVNVHDIVITVTSAAEVRLAGMPSNVSEPVFLLEGLAPSTTYYATVKAQGRGWETEWSDPLEITTGDSGALPVVTVPGDLPDFPAGIEGTVSFTVSGDPRPAVTVRNSSVAPSSFTLTTDSWDAASMTGTFTLAYLPAAADLLYGTQNFYVTATNAYGADTVAISLRVTLPPAPEDLSATDVTSSGFTLAWTAIPGTEGYDVQVSADPGFPDFAFADLVFEPACTVTGLLSGTTYYARVAVSIATNSVWSDILAVTTVAQTAEQAFDQWLADRFDATTNSMGFAATNDVDGDGMTTWQEFLADTCPTDAASRLKFELDADLTTATQAVFRFASRTGRWYRLLYRTNLLDSLRTNNLGPGPAEGEITIRTNFDDTWFGTIRVLRDGPHGE